VRAWTSAGAWIETIRRYFQTPEGDLWRREHRYSVSLGTLVAIARADASSADYGTGRGVATSNESVAARVGCCAKTVQRARVMLTDAGFYVTVAEGRYLFNHEREQACRLHGGAQLRAASVRALTLPKWAAVQNVHLPAVGRVKPSSPVNNFPPTRAAARSDAATRRGAETKRPSAGRRRRRRTSQPPSESMLLFAAQLTGRLPWLRHNHRLAVCAVIARAGWPVDQLDVDDLLTLHEQRNAQLHLCALSADQVRHPLGYLARILAAAQEHAATTGYASGAQRRAAAETERAERMARQAHERAARAAAAAASQSAEAIAAREAFFADHHERSQTRPAVRRLADDRELARVRAQLDELRRRRGDK